MRRSGFGFHTIDLHTRRNTNPTPDKPSLKIELPGHILPGTVSHGCDLRRPLSAHLHSRCIQPKCGNADDESSLAVKPVPAKRRRRFFARQSSVSHQLSEAATARISLLVLSTRLLPHAVTAGMGLRYTFLFALSGARVVGVRLSQDSSLAISHFHGICTAKFCVAAVCDSPDSHGRRLF